MCKSFGAATAYIANGIISNDTDSISYVCVCVSLFLFLHTERERERLREETGIFTQLSKMMFFLRFFLFLFFFLLLIVPMCCVLSDGGERKEIRYRQEEKDVVDVGGGGGGGGARLRPETLCLLAAGCHCPPVRLVNITKPAIGDGILLYIFSLGSLRFLSILRSFSDFFKSHQRHSPNRMSCICLCLVGKLFGPFCIQPMFDHHSRLGLSPIQALVYSLYIYVCVSVCVCLCLCVCIVDFWLACGTNWSTPLYTSAFASISSLFVSHQVWHSIQLAVDCYWLPDSFDFFFSVHTDYQYSIRQDKKSEIKEKRIWYRGLNAVGWRCRSECPTPLRSRHWPS